MKGMKFWIDDDEELSARVQTILFELGYSWSMEGKSIHNQDEGCLYARDECITHTESDRKFFDAHRYEEINIDWMRSNKFVSIDISDNYKGVIHKDGTLEVGCQKIDFETIEKVYELAKKQRKT